MISEVKRKALNKSLSKGLFIDKNGVLTMKKIIEGRLYKKKFGQYETGKVTEANEFLNNLCQKHRLRRLNLPVPESDMTLGQAMNLVWAKYGSKKEGRLARQYKQQLLAMVQFFGSDRIVGAITPQGCEDFLEDVATRTVPRTDRLVRGSTVNRYRTAAIAFFNLLERWQVEGTIADNVRLPKRNPARFTLKRPEGETHTKPPTEAQYENLLACAADNGVRRIIIGAAVMMRRRVELMRMRLSTHLDRANGVLTGPVSKRKPTDKVRLYTVVITPVVQMLIDTAPGDFIFNFKNWRRRWERTLLRAGLATKVGEYTYRGRKLPKIKTHFEFRQLRKFGGTQLNLRGVDARTIQEMYRHSSLEMTQRYVGAVPKAQKDASEILDGQFHWHKEKVSDSVPYVQRKAVAKYQELIEK